jgi:hypothetical protein
MASYGYQSDHINLIADNLRDRYKSGFPILKELMQNADDAKARRLVFGLHPGFKGQSSHPLLQGPGLWLFNDGQFKKEDERAIRSFGLNTKAGESGSIGKFGLGMKSVFHLCEAFFYVAYDGQRHVDVLLNPWRDPDGEDLFHRSWDQVGTQEFDALRGVLAQEQLDKGCASWFLMWIPLRCREHVPQKDGKPYGGIIDKYPGEAGSNEMQDLFDGKLSSKIRSVVPLLRNLESIEFASAIQTQGFKVQILFDDATQRVDHSSAELVSTGSVSDGGASKGKLRFRVQQKALAGRLPFSQFQKLDVWPKTGRLNSDGIREPVPDKSEAEGAVLVSGAPADGDQAKLVIDWAVFLPMEEGLSYECLLDKSLQQYRIVLHGQFFVDAGRRGIAGFGHLAIKSLEPTPNLDDADLHTGWNQSVAQLVVLPQFLPTLAQFSNDLNDYEKEELARAVLNARTKSNAVSIGKGFWENFREFICHEQAWVRLITPKGLKWSHVKISQDSRLLLLPPPPRSDLEQPWKVLPKLKKLVDDGCLLIDEGAPSLMRTHSNWDAKTLLEVLSDIDLDEACSKAGMLYLTSFLSLEERRYVNESAVQRKLTALLRTMLRHKPIQVFRSHRSTFQELVSLVNLDYRFAVGTKKTDTVTGLDDNTLALLMSADVDKVLLPMDLDPEKNDASRGIPDEKEIRSLLKTIDREMSRLTNLNGGALPQQAENLLRAAQSVLALLSDKKDERGQAVRVNRSLRILTATSARTHQSMAVTFDELQSAHQSRLLFKRIFGSGAAAYPVAAELAKLLPTEKIWVVDADIASWVQRGEQNAGPVPSADDRDAAYVALGKPGRTLLLADMKVRGQFIRTINAPSLKGDDIIRGMRYVLHGSDRHHGDLESTLWINTDRMDEVWIKLKCMIEPDSWNVVDPSLAGAVKADDRVTLGISKVGPEEIITHMMAGYSIDRIQASQLSEVDITQILSRIDDEKLWKSLPLHCDATGNFGYIDENCYVDRDGLANPLFLNGIRIIPLSSDKKLREKQTQWVSPWTPQTTIERALAQTAAEKHWELILESIGNFGLSSLNGIPALRSTKWLPLAKGGAISPEDVIDFEQLAADIDLLASGCGYCYAGILAISKDAKKHASFSKIKPLFASGKSGLERLGQLMVEAGGRLVGKIPLPDITEALIYDLAEIRALPAWAIVKAAIDAVGSERINEVTEHLIKEIQKPLLPTELIEVLNEISAQNNTKLLVVFNLYLQQLANYSEDLPLALGKIQLLARDGRWKSASTLCVGVQGVVKGSVLHDEQARILENYLSDITARGRLKSAVSGSVANGEDVESSDAKGKAQTVLMEYFKPWRESIPSGPVGAFFALLGPAFRSLAMEWLKPHSFEYFAGELGWVEPKSRNSPVWDIQRREHTKLEALEMLEFLPTISKSKEIAVMSLLGEEVRVPIDTAIEGLVMGNLAFSGTRGGKSFFRLRLREVPHPEKYEKTALTNMLRKTCECILREAYNQQAPNLGVLWETLEKSNQLELAVARGLILDRLPYDLRNLSSAKKNPALSKWQSNFKKLESSRAEKTEAKQATDRVDKEIADAKLDLSKLMTSDPQVQDAILNGIRKQVEKYQYKVSSIPFEILQNADDAVTELQSLMRADATVAHPCEHVGRFVMEIVDSTVRFLHWGRPVNYMGHGESRNESYGEDLQRMLVLAASDKDETTGLTGKFGLGFKSVLLATDAPCLLSGDLKAKIVGGCLPKQWSDAKGATDLLQQHRLSDAPGLRGTVVEFKLDHIEKRSQVLDRFAALAGLQCVFNKEIRSIQINETLHQWIPTLLGDDFLNIEIGLVRLPEKRGLNSSRLLNFRMDNGCLALKLGSRGFVRFQENVDHFPPGVWVTAPTREPAANGLILNSQFELDTGRGGLPHGEGSRSNLVMAERLGSIAADLVAQATLRSRNNWEQTRAQLQLAKDVTPSEFWATFWEQIPGRKADEGESNRLLSHFGLRLLERFLAISGEIPNGLSGTASSFVAPENACLALNSRWEKLYAPLSKWPDFVNQFPISGWISADVAAQLTLTSSCSEALPEVSVLMLMDLVPGKGCSAEVMNTLSALLDGISLEEAEIVSRQMVNFKFQAKDGSWNFGRQLLKVGVESDRPSLPFAPPSSILHASYKGDGFTLVQKYAAFEKPPASVLANWILAAPSDPQAGRVAGLSFLLGNPDLRGFISFKLIGTWIESLNASSALLSSFSVQEKNQLLVMFNPEPVWNTNIPEAPSPELLTGDEALESIRDWWQENSAEQLKKFDRKFWPTSVPRHFDSIYDDRASWMTLFAIGLMQRHGRVRPEQNRGFINAMHYKGWWNTFSTISPRENGQAWLNILNEYGEQQIEDEEYSQWMDNFPRLYRMARWFDAYTHAFQSLDNRDRSETSGRLSPGADPVMSGSGIHAPSMRRSLKLGQHVVIRELLRARVLQSETAKALAFKPGDAVKQMLSGMGFTELAGDSVTSEQIYDTLHQCLGDGATFDGAYDIPLLILAGNQNLQQQVLGNAVTYLSEFDEE